MSSIICHHHCLCLFHLIIYFIGETRSLFSWIVFNQRKFSKPEKVSSFLCFLQTKEIAVVKNVWLELSIGKVHAWPLIAPSVPSVYLHLVLSSSSGVTPTLSEKSMKSRIFLLLLHTYLGQFGITPGGGQGPHREMH